MENIVVMGGGHVGLTLAVDLELRKNETGLRPHIVQIRDSGHPFDLKSAARDDGVDVEVEDILTGEMVQCQFPEAQIHKTSNDMRDILANAKMIVVTVPDIPHLRQRVFKWIKNNLPDHHMTIVLVRGGQGGLISVIDAWRNDPALRRQNIVLVEDSFYGTRFIDGKIAFKRKRKTNISIFGPQPETALSHMRRLFIGQAVPADAHNFVLVRPVDLQFDPLGYIIHLAVTLDQRNLELTNQGIQYLHYSDGVHKWNADSIEILDKERVLLATQYGASTRMFSDILSEQYGLPRKGSFLEMMKATKAIYRSLSPASMEDLRASRLIQEDAPALFTMNWLCSQCESDLPATKAHTKNIQGALQRLNIDVAPLRKYADDLENSGRRREDIISLLTCPA